MLGQGAQDPQLKFNDLFNQHFPWRGGGGGKLMNGEVEVNYRIVIEK